MITLKEFIAEKERILNHFSADWNTEKIENPDEFPDEMESDDWEERFEAFVWFFE